MVSRLQGVEPRLLFTRISLGTEGDTESTIDGQDTGWVAPSMTLADKYPSLKPSGEAGEHLLLGWRAVSWLQWRRRRRGQAGLDDWITLAAFWGITVVLTVIASEFAINQRQRTARDVSRCLIKETTRSWVVIDHAKHHKVANAAFQCTSRWASVNHSFDPD